MKVWKYGILGIVAIALWTSCGPSASVVGTAGYGYYDDLYYYGHPGYFSGPVYVYERPLILHRIIEVPANEENQRVIQRKQTRSRSSETHQPRTVSPSQERQIRQGSAVQRRGSSVETPSRSNTREGSRQRRGTSPD